MKKILVSSLLSLVITGTTFAEQNERLYPHGCRQLGFSFDNDQVVFSRIDGGQQETVYLVRNNSPYEIIMEAETSSKYIPGFKKTFSPEHWAAFSRLDKSLRFDCRLSSQYHGHEEPLNCQEVLQICNYNRAKFPDQNLGTYWLQKTSVAQKNVIDFVIHKGILLRW